MTVTKAESFGFLGDDFQLKVLSQLVCDRDFGLNIIEIMHSKYFDNEHYRQIASIIKDYNQKYDNTLPSISGLKESIIMEVKDELNKQYLIKIVEKLEDKSLEDDLSTKDNALKFCKQQEAKKAITQCQDIISRGDFQNYDLLESIMRKALEVNEEKDNAVDLYDNIDNVLSGKNKIKIRTGINGLDEALRGGPAKKEVACFIAPTGIGKSTFLTKVANTAHIDKSNVLQIIFEDDEVDIQAKHFTCITGIELNELEKTKSYVKEKVQESKENSGILRIKVAKKGATTVPHIRQYLRKYRNKGVLFDLLVLDYLDCMVASKDINGVVGDEGTIIADLEELAKEFNLLIWTAVQSNRSGYNKETIDMDSTQGSIKRVQGCHLVVSGSKNAEQKVLGLANMQICKSRSGGDGQIFENMTFNNSTMVFDTTPNNTITWELGAENDKKQKEKNEQKAADALRQLRAAKEIKNNSALVN